MTDIHTLFDRLDAWRHLPAYQLERRADIFFSLYLADVVGSKLGVAMDPRLVPEFPIKKEDNNQSEKADYALWSTDRSRLVLVEPDAAHVVIDFAELARHAIPTRLVRHAWVRRGPKLILRVHLRSPDFK